MLQGFYKLHKLFHKNLREIEIKLIFAFSRIELFFVVCFWRRLRFSKVAVAIQTEDLSSAIKRDVSVGGQTDLILFREAGSGTDVDYIEKRCSNSGDC